MPQFIALLSSDPQSAPDRKQHRRSEADAALLVRLRAGDEHAYAELVASYARSMLRVALRYSRSRAVAEEAVQETWLAVVQGLDGFEGRASLKTWVFRILVNQVRIRAARELRVRSITDVLGANAHEPGEYAEEHLLSSSWERWPGHWSVPLGGLATLPDKAALAAELMSRVREVVACLPERQRTVLTMRDIDGCTAEEVCRHLNLEPNNQRVLLHRARLVVRAALVPYLAEHTEVPMPVT
jgi:RNA polymerase sigma-70 factor (ECF subfamily)